MNTRTEKTLDNKDQAITNSSGSARDNKDPEWGMVDSRPEALSQRRSKIVMDQSPGMTHLKSYQRMADNYTLHIVQPKQEKKAEMLQGEVDSIGEIENKTGLPDDLKAGMENLSGYSLDDVKVHYNSDKPAQLQAHAYAQGTDIHLASGQERHLPHEAWHVVQQKQGRVKPTAQMKAGVPLNDDAGLENEADVMGYMALNFGTEPKSHGVTQRKETASNFPFPVVQRFWAKGEMEEVAQMREKERTSYFVSTKYGLVDDVISYYLVYPDHARNELELVLSCYYEIEERERNLILQRFYIKAKQNEQVDQIVEQGIERADKTVRDDGRIGKALRSIAGGSLTSIRDDFGDLSPSLSTEGREDKLALAASFGEFFGRDYDRRNLDNPAMIKLYRRVKSSHLRSLQPGAVIDEILPFSTSWKEGFVREWSPTEGVIFEFEIPATYPALFQSRRPGAVIAPGKPEGMNVEQAEVTLIQSRLKVLCPAENRNGEFFVKVSLEPLSLDVARKQHIAMNAMSDDDRRLVAHQQGEDPVKMPTNTQQELSKRLITLEPQVSVIIDLARRADQNTIEKVKKRIYDFYENQKDALKIPLGVGHAVIKGFQMLDASSPELLSTLIRRLFSAQYLVDSKTTVDKTHELLLILLKVFLSLLKK